MKLLTKEIEKKLANRNAEIAQRNRADYYEFFENDEVIVKYFNPYGGGTWYIMSGEKQPNGDWILFGLCEIFDREWGDVSLNELAQLDLPLGLKIERDLHYDGRYSDLKRLHSERW
jgi:hypothetical protein